MDQSGYMYYDIDGILNNKTFLNYYYDTYQIETFENLVFDNTIIEILFKSFLFVSILIALTDFLLLVTVFTATARQQSASWYLYHFNFLVILHVIFSLQTLEGTYHKSFGSCMFSTFTNWTLTLLFDANLILMDIEIIATIFTGSVIWKNCSKKRFFIAMTAVWNSCLLISVMIMFFGHEEHVGIPICFNQNRTAQILGVVMRDWFPCFISTAFAIAGLVFFIKTKRRSVDYNHISDGYNNVQTINEWFAVFIVWNTTVVFSKCLVFVMHYQFFDMGIVGAVVYKLTIYIILIGLPVTSIFLEPVRTVGKEWAIACFRFVTSSNRTHGVSDTDQLTAEMEAC